MDSKRWDVKLSPSMRSSNRGEPSAPKKVSSLTIFEDLLDSPNNENLHPVANLEAPFEKDSSEFHYQNEANAVVEIENNSWLATGFNRISDDNMVYQRIKNYLVSSLNCGGFHVQVETIYKNGHSSSIGGAKSKSFDIYSTAIKEKSGGNANVHFAWYGASEDEINRILSYGFGLPFNDGVYGHGFYFSAVDQPLESLRPSTADADGIRHMLLCRVILGKVEVITPGSAQHNPSSEEFDTGVDSLVHPRKFIIWNTKVNTHVLPEYIVSFRTSSN